MKGSTQCDKYKQWRNTIKGSTKCDKYKHWRNTIKGSRYHYYYYDYPTISTTT
jgi:hypothetical protein